LERKSVRFVDPFETGTLVIKQRLICDLVGNNPLVDQTKDSFVLLPPSQGVFNFVDQLALMKTLRNETHLLNVALVVPTPHFLVVFFNTRLPGFFFGQLTLQRRDLGFKLCDAFFVSHGLSSLLVSVAVCCNERLDKLDDLLLLTAGQMGSCFENLTEFAARSHHPFRLRFSKQFLDRDSQDSGYWDEDIGTRNVSTPFPVAHVGMRLANLAGQFAHGEASGFSEFAQTRFICHVVNIHEGWKKFLHMDNILPIIGQCKSFLTTFQILTPEPFMSRIPDEEIPRFNPSQPKILRVPQSEVDRLKRAVPLEQLCKLYGIDLKPCGKDLAARCPFHDDGTPSFKVTPSKNLWNCLGGCGGGDNIKLVMKRENVSFRRAIERLKDILGETPSAPVVKILRGIEHEVLIDHEVSDDELMRHVVEYYHRSFMNDPKAMQYLQSRCCFHPEAITKFKLGYANRTLGYRVPFKGTVHGTTLRDQLCRIGIYRKSGHEHLNGSVVIPIFDRHEQVTQLYGRKICKVLPSIPKHLYLEKPLRGVWNSESLLHQKEWLLCEAPLDALTLWCHGFRNVTCSYGTNNFTSDHWTLIEEWKPERIVICYDNDRAGNEAAAKLAEELAVKGFTVLRAKPPLDRDVNDLACESQEPQAALASMLERAEILFNRHTNETPLCGQDHPGKGDIEKAASPLLAAADAAKKKEEKTEETKTSVGEATATTSEIESDWETDTHTLSFGRRVWRLRGLSKNLSYEILKVQLRVKFGDFFFTDTLDLYNAKHRQNFVLQAQAETQVAADVLKRDIGQVLLAAEVLQEKIIKQTLEPIEKTVTLTQDDREQALELLRDPKLLDRILEDYERCGVVGETTNKLAGYLAAVSRKMDDPLAIIIQSTSAAGKSALMEAVLAFMPEEERVKYSAMTGQSLYYLGDADLKHKILAIVEEEGAEKVSYALKLLQSEGELTIASTGKDPNTGRMVTQEYRVEGPVMILLTTTAIEIDEELLNRCIILTVDESREQTRRIHHLQREAETLDGLLRKLDKQKILVLHRNAQRLLRPLRVVNPYAQRLTFLDDRMRTRRDHTKYLALIRVIALLRQYQRETHVANGTQYIEVTLDDIAVANRLAGDVLGRSLDELPPQTRRLLIHIEEMVSHECQRLKMHRADYRFSRRDVRERIGWGNTQLKAHLHRLEEMEYLIVHRARRGQGFIYEILYAGEGKDGSAFLPGLIDVTKLGYDAERSGINGQRSAPGRGEVGGMSGDGRDQENGVFNSLSPLSGDKNGSKLHENGQDAQAGQKKEGGSRSRTPSLPRGAR